MRIFISLLLLVISGYSPAMGNDGFGALGVGGIIVGKTGNIALAKEVLNISYKRISVEYDFVNESTSAITSDIVFPLPAYPATPNESGVIAFGQPSDFNVSVNGHSVEFDTKVMATIIGGEDVTDKLRSIGLSDKQIALFPFDNAPQDAGHGLHLSAAQVAALTKQKLLWDDGVSPTWDINVTYQWKQTFAAGSSIHVSHAYTPFIAEGTAGGFQGVDSKEFLSEFCPTDSQIGALNRLFSAKKNLDVYGEVPGTIVKYVLTTANTWKDGIRDFTLKVTTFSPDETVSLCFPEPLAKVSENTYAARLFNFKPKTDLSIYFGNIAAAKVPVPQYGVAPQFSNSKE